MATIGNLSVSLTALTGKFTAGMRGASRTLDTFGSKVKAIGTALTSTRALMAGLATGVAVSFAKKLADNIDATAKLADSLGTTTQELAGLRHGADLAGASAETLDGALAQLQKRLGTGAATKALESLGLGDAKLMGKNPAQQFSMVADAVSKLATQEAKAAAVTELFGRSGQQLLPLLSEGSAGLRAYAEDARKLGLAFSRVDAAKVEMANDAITRVKAAITGGLQTAVIQLAPFIQAIADRFTEAMTQGGGFAGVVKTAFDAVLAAVQQVGTAMDRLGIAWDWVVGKFLKGAANIRSMTGFADGHEVADLIEGDARIGRAQRNTVAMSSGGGQFATAVSAAFAKIQKDAAKGANDIALKGIESTVAKMLDEQARRETSLAIAGLKDMGRRFLDVAGGVINRAIDSSGVLRGNPGFDDVARWRAIGFGMDNQNRSVRAPDSIATAAGSAGTFGSLGGRLVGAQTMVQRQTELLERIADSSETTADAIGSGIPLPEGP